MHNDEYYTIAELENEHWWYKSLHNLVHSVLEKNFNNKLINIIDAGCGTGGLMTFLLDKGYKNVRGFDISEIAVTLCTDKGLDVFKGSLEDIADYLPAYSADVIISNDTFYFLDEFHQRSVTDIISRLLKKNGLLILNLPSLESFSGIHDLRVGIRSRFNSKDVRRMLDYSKYSLVEEVYWPFILSPLIWMKRYTQRISMKLNKSYKIKSDLKKESVLINRLLFSVTNWENVMMKRKPFGSSLFLVAKVNHSHIHDGTKGGKI